MAKGNGNCQDTYKNPDLKKRAIVSVKAKKKNGKKKVPPKKMPKLPFMKG